jgi:hypothetical protein
MQEKNVVESRGFWSRTNRMELRPACVYDQRSVFTHDAAEFERAIKERKSISEPEIQDMITEAIIIED